MLVVEDEGVIALHLEDQLREMGYEVVGVATTGEDAIAQVGALNPDLVLMDIRLGEGMDGIEAAARIRARRAVPVVFLTANAQEELVQRATRVGSDGYLVKPVQRQALYAALETVLARAQRTRDVHWSPVRAGKGLTLTEALVQTEEDMVHWAMERTSGNVSAAARLLGTNRPRIYKVLDRQQERPGP